MKRRKSKKISVRPKKLITIKEKSPSLALGILVVGIALFILFNLSPKTSPAISDMPKIKTTQSAMGALTNQVVTPTPVKLILPLSKGQTISYVVKQGDSLAKIGAFYCQNNRAWLVLAEKNGLFPPYTLHSADTITVVCEE